MLAQRGYVRHRGQEQPTPAEPPGKLLQKRDAYCGRKAHFRFTPFVLPSTCHSCEFLRLRADKLVPDPGAEATMLDTDTCSKCASGYVVLLLGLHPGHCCDCRQPYFATPASELLRPLGHGPRASCPRLQTLSALCAPLVSACVCPPCDRFVSSGPRALASGICPLGACCRAGQWHHEA